MHAELTQTCGARMAQRQRVGKDSGRFQKSNYSQLYEFVGGGAPMCGFLLTSYSSSRMISSEKVIVKPRSGSASLPDPVALQTEEHRLEREQNERGVLEALETTSVTPECLSRMCLRFLT